MNSTQMACLQKLINALQECENVGISFSHSYLRLDVEYEESHYLENLSANKLSELLNFIDGCGVFSSKKGSHALAIRCYNLRQEGFTLSQIADIVCIDKEKVRARILLGERLSDAGQLGEDSE